MYCEQSQSETTIYIQSVYYKDTVSSYLQSIYVESQHVKQIGELIEIEGEREREQHINGVRDGALDQKRSTVN